MEIIIICCISEDEDFGVLLQTLHGKSCSILFEKISALCKMFEFLFLYGHRIWCYEGSGLLIFSLIFSYIVD